MFYREAGQFKTSYAADQQVFPIRQDRIAIALLLAVAFFAVPMFASEYWLKGIIIPFLIFALAALGLNILTGYAGQLSLGSAAFMAVGAYAAFNFMLRIDGMPLIAAFALGGLSAALGGWCPSWMTKRVCPRFRATPPRWWRWAIGRRR